MAKKMKLEDKRQIEFLDDLEKYDFLFPAFIRNEQGFNNVSVGKHIKKMGRMAGFSDLLIYDTRYVRTIYHVEMKAWSISRKTGKVIGKGRATPVQKVFRGFVERQGFKYFLIDSPEAKINFFKEILKR